MTSKTATLPTPSKHHSTCAWCSQPFATIVDLIDHVDGDHLGTGSGDLRRAA